MNDTFKVISDFLARTSGDVEGRVREEVPEEVSAKLKAFASGTLEPASRSEVAELLKKHPDWVSILAVETKALRERGNSAG